MPDLPSEEKEHKKQSLIPLIPAFALPAVLGYLVARRPFRNDYMSKLIRRKGLARAIDTADPSGGKLFNSLQYGTPNVINEKAIRRLSTKSLDKPLHDPADLLTGEVKSKYPLSKTNPDLSGIGDNKILEAELFKKHAPKAMPPSLGMNEALREMGQTGRGSKWRKIPNPKKIRMLQDYLKQKFPKGFILKGTSDFQSAGSLLTDKDDLLDIYKSTRRTPKTVTPAPDIFQRLLGKKPKRIKLKGMDEVDVSLAAKHAPEILHKNHLERLLRDPKSMMAQERIKLLPTNFADKIVSKLQGGLPTSQEIRVHVVNGEVVPSLTVNRHGQVSNALHHLFGLRPSGAGPAEKLVSDTLSKFPKKFVHKQNYGFDIGMTKQGPRVLESNPAGQSGLLFPSSATILGKYFDPYAAIMGNKLVSHLQGQNTPLIAGMRGLGWGAAGLGAAAAANELTDN